MTALPTRRQRNPRGFLLLEALMAAALIVVFAAVAGWTTVATLRLMRDAPARANRLVQIDGFTSTLQADVWSAFAHTLTPTSLSLETPTGKVLWTLAPDGSATRTDPTSQPRSWPAVAPAGAFSDTSPHIQLPSRLGTLTLTPELARLAAGGAK